MPAHRSIPRRSMAVGHWLLISAMPVIVALALAACGMKPTPPPSSPAVSPVLQTPIPVATSQSLPTPQFTPTSIPPMTPTLIPTPFGVTCGTVEIRDGVIVNPDATITVEDCFWKAYQTCAIGDRLGIIRTSAETPSFAAVTYNLMNQGGQCTIEEAGGAVPIVRDATTGATVISPGAPINDRCTGMTRDPQGNLHFTGCILGTSHDLLTP